MLKSSTAETSTHYRLVLAGRMVGTGVAELRRMCARLQAELRGRALVIDMREVVVVSQEGENVLLHLINNGAKLCPAGVLAKRILQQLAHRTKKKVGELVAESRVAIGEKETLTSPLRGDGTSARCKR